MEIQLLMISFPLANENEGFNTGIFYNVVQ